jgi:hypothetical protein
MRLVADLPTGAILATMTGVDNHVAVVLVILVATGHDYRLSTGRLRATDPSLWGTMNTSLMGKPTTTERLTYCDTRYVTNHGQSLAAFSTNWVPF